MVQQASLFTAATQHLHNPSLLRYDTPSLRSKDHDMLKPHILRLNQVTPLNYDDYIALFADLVRSDNEPQIVAILVLLNTRSEAEHVDMITAAVHVLREHMHPLQNTQPSLDIVGTGGDGHHTINISTAASLILASMGVRVIKHGNRSVSSKSGSADVLEALGIDIQKHHQHPDFRFCYAPLFHPVLSRFKLLRKQLGIPTIFNQLGPLLNPGMPSHIIIGVNHVAYLPVYAKVCKQLGFEHALIVHTGSMDELACHATPQVIELNQSRQSTYRLDIESLGLSPCRIQDLVGGSAKHNARDILTILANQPHPARDTIILNVAAGLYLFGKADSIAAAVPAVHEALAAGIPLAFAQELGAKSP